VHKWTKSACVVLAGCILPAVMAAGMMGSVRPAPANHRIANSITQVTLASSVSMTTPRATAPKATDTAKYVVRPGDTLSAIAGALAVPGGWQALYAANRPRIGANPNVIRPGTVLVLPGPRASVRYTVTVGDTLSGIASRLAVPGGWQALYAANRPRIGANPNVIRPGTVLVLPGPRASVRYTVAVGDTLSGIASRLAVPGGWPALYVANRRAIGPDPNLLRPGAILVTPRLAASAPGTVPAAPGTGQGHQRPAPAQPRPSAPATTHPSGHASSPAAAPSPATTPSPITTPPPASAQSPRAANPPRPAVTRPAATRLPRWLETLLLSAGLLIGIAFLSEPAIMLARRRRRGREAREAVEKARIVLADHERLIVTYSTADDTVYVLTPPGEDPRAVLRAARLVLPDDTYEVLAGRLGVPANWPLE
jgi:LysM repeat protein